MACPTDGAAGVTRSRWTLKQVYAMIASEYVGAAGFIVMQLLRISDFMFEASAVHSKKFVKGHRRPSREVDAYCWAMLGGFYDVHRLPEVWMERLGSQGSVLSEAKRSHERTVGMRKDIATSCHVEQIKGVVRAYIVQMHIRLTSLRLTLIESLKLTEQAGHIVRFVPPHMA